MLEIKPYLPHDIDPSTVALRLFFKDKSVTDAYGRRVEYEEVFTSKELYQNNSTPIVCRANVGIPVEIYYDNGLLAIKSSAAVDIYLSGVIPAKSIHIETMGDCVIYDGNFLAAKLKMFVVGKIISLEIPILDGDFIALESILNINGKIAIDKVLITKGLILEAEEIIFNSKLQADKIYMSCKKMDCSQYVELTITGKPYSLSPLTNVFHTSCDKKHGIFNAIDKSKINIAYNLFVRWKLNLRNTNLHCGGKIEFGNERCIVLNNSDVVAKSLHVPHKTIVLGGEILLNLSEIITVDGKIVAQDIIIHSGNIDVSKDAIVDGMKKLIMHAREYISVLGTVKSDCTTIDSEFTNVKFGGIVNGKDTLTISGAVTAALFGGCYSGGRIVNKAAINIKLFGLVSSHSASFDSLVNLEFGNLSLPYVEFKNISQDLYNLACISLKEISSASYQKYKDYYRELLNILPQSMDELFDMIAMSAGVIRTLLSSISIPLSTLFSFTYQARALISQLVHLNKTYDWSTLTNMANQPSKDILKLVLDLKGLLISGGALHKNTAGFSSPINSRISVSTSIVNLASLAMPVVQNDSLFDASAPFLRVIGTDTSQNLFSVKAGNSVAFNKFDQTLFDQYDFSNLLAHNVVYSCGGTRHYNGRTLYSGVIDVSCKNYQSSSESSIRAGNNSQYFLTTNSANLSGAENHSGVSYVIKDLPLSDANDLLQGVGQFEHIKVTASIAVTTEREGNVVFNKLFRGPDIKYALTVPGDITLDTELSGSGIYIESTNGSIYQQKNLIMQNDVSLVAVNNVVTSDVLTKSINGNVAIVAGQTANNDHGHIVAINGNASVIGGNVTCKSDDPLQKSSVIGRNSLVCSTVGNVDIHNALIQGLVTAKVHVAGDLNINPATTYEWLSQHEMGNVYSPSLILGGTGNLDNNGVGLEFIINGKFNACASQIKSLGKLIIYAKNGFNAKTNATVFIAEDRSDKHGVFNKVYYVSEDVKFFDMSLESGDGIKILSDNGEVSLFGVKMFAPNGSEVIAKNNNIAQPVAVTLHKSETKNKITNLKDKRLSFTDDSESETVFYHTTGITSFTSLEGNVVHKNVIYIGDKGSEFAFSAHKNVSTSLGVMNHRVKDTQYSLQFSAFGQTWIGANNKFNIMNLVNTIDPTSGSAYDYLKSTNIMEGLVNAGNALSGMCNTAEAIKNSSLQKVIADKVSGSVSLSRTTQTLDYQTEGFGGFYGGAKISAVSRTGNVTLSVNIYDNPDVSIKARSVHFKNNTLYSKFKHNNLTVSASLNLAGEYDVGASLQHSKMHSATQTQRTMDIDLLEIDTDHLLISGTAVHCKDIKGRADIVETEDLKNFTKVLDQSYGASKQGKINFSISSTVEETFGAIGNLHVANGINYLSHTFNCNKHINHGKLGISTDNALTNKLDALYEQNDLIFNYIRKGVGLCSDISRDGFSKSSSLSLDFHRKQDIVSDDGLHHVKDYKFKGKVIVPSVQVIGKLINGDTAPRMSPELDRAIYQLNNDDYLSSIDMKYQPSRYPDLGGGLQQLHNMNYLSASDIQYRHIPLDNGVSAPFIPATIVSSSDLSNSDRVFPSDAPKNNSVNESGQIQAPKNAPEKSFIRKFVDLFEQDDDYNTDFYDLNSNRELRRGQAFVTKSIGRHVVASTKAFFDYSVWLDVGTFTWDGINLYSNDFFGIANQNSLVRMQAREKAMVDAWNTFKDLDGMAKSYVMLDLVTGFTVSLATGGTLGAAERYVATKLASNVLNPMLRTIRNDVQEIYNIRNSFYNNKGYSWSNNTKSNFTGGFASSRPVNPHIDLPVRLFDINNPLPKTIQKTSLALDVRPGKPYPMIFSQQNWINKLLESNVVQKIDIVQPIIFDEVVEHRYPSQCPYTVKYGLSNPNFRKQYGFTVSDPTVRIHESWAEDDFLSKHDFYNPEQCLPHEAEIITQWMFDRKPVVELFNRLDIEIIQRPKIREKFKSIRNQLIDHLTPGDLCAIMKENRGVQIYRSDGEVHIHKNEWSQAKNTRDNAIELYWKYNSIFNSDERILMRTMLDEIEKLWPRYQKLIDRAKNSINGGSEKLKIKLKPKM